MNRMHRGVLIAASSVVAVATIAATVVLVWQESASLPVAAVPVAQPPASVAVKGLASDELAASPLLQLQSATSRSPQLEAWAVKWDAREAGTPASEADLRDLKDALVASEVPALARLQVARLLVAAKDNANAILWTKSGLDRAKTEWSSNGPAGTAFPETGLAWDTLKDAATPLWRTSDRDGIASLLAVESLLPRRNQWDQQPEWHRVNYIGLLTGIKEYDAAHKEVEAVRNDPQIHLTDGQQTKLSQAEAKALFGLKQYDKAKVVLISRNLTTGPNNTEMTLLLTRVNDELETQLHSTPLAVLEAHGKVRTELTIWAKQWQAATVDPRPNNETALAALVPVIAASDLSANERLAIGQHLFNASDKVAAATWFHAAIDQAKIDFDVAMAAAPGDAASKSQAAERVLAPLLPKLETAGVLLWETFDGVGEQKLTEMVMALPRSGPSSQRPEWARIGHAEALYLQSRYKEALEEADLLTKLISNQHNIFTDHQKIEIHWLKAIVLSKLNRYSEEILELSLVTRVQNPHQKRAIQLQVRALGSLGMREAAEKILRDYQTKFGVDDAETEILENAAKGG